MDTKDLIITKCPEAFLEFAEKHNRVVYLLANMSGAGGISVAVAAANIIIDGSGITGGGGTGSITYTSVSLTACVGGTATAITFITSVGLV